MENVQLFLVLVAVFALPLALGQYLARAFRMPDHGWRIATVLFAFFAAAAVTYFGWPPRLGIDLRGGSQLVYEVDQAQRTSDEPINMEKLILAVQKRIDPDGVQEVTIRRYGIDSIEIIIPDTDAEELERIKKRVSSTGLLEFRIAANERQHKDQIELAKKLDLDTHQLFVELSDGTREEAARWVPGRPGQFLDGRYTTRKNAKDQLEVLVIKDEQDVTGQYIRSTTASVGQKGHQVEFRFKTEGGRLFRKLTSDNLPQTTGGQQQFSQLGIILDGQLYSAPQINSIIEDSGEISGDFTQVQAEDLARVLTAGSLPTALRKEPSTSLTTGPTLGADTIRKGVNAMLVATTAVIVFMVVYYRFAGVVANIALLLNVLLIVAFMIIFRAAFTLSGLAGLALTVGMAVDANVLIYERMREELSRGATLRMAIRNGFGRASTTIIDANVTTLISAVVLYVIGTDQVKGFAITLILGIVMNLFTAIFVSRVIFDVAEKTRFVKGLSMLHILSNPNFEFISKWKIATGISAVLIAIGIAGAYVRGKGILDIDFTGGTSVQMLFSEPMETAQVRKAIDSRAGDLPDATVQDVKIQDEKPGIRFVINTSNQEKEKVEEVLKVVFEGKLLTNSFEQIGPLAQITEVPKKKGLMSDTRPTSIPARKTETPKTETPKPEAPKEEAAKPDAPATETPAPEAPKSDEPKSDEPQASKTSPRFLDSDANLLALADAQDKADPATEPTKTDAAKTNEVKADAPVADAPKTDVPATESPKADAPKATTPPAGPLAEKPLTDAAPVATSRLVGGTRAELKFSTPIGADELLDTLTRALVDTPSADQGTLLEVDNDKYEEKSTKDFETWTVRASLPQDKLQAVLTRANSILVDEPIFPESNQIGAKVADNTQQQAAMAMAASLLLILAYVWFRFSQVMFGVAAVVAVVHDVLVTFGAIALSYWLANVPGFDFLLVEPFKISLPIIAAFLTIIGYSLNDTIVIFDRIREARGKSPTITPALANRCINETLSRTILTSLTVFIVVLILYIAGGQAIHGFAFALVVGVIAGSYSTIYIATPIVLWMNRFAEDKSKASASASKVPQRTSPA